MTPLSLNQDNRTGPLLLSLTRISLVPRPTPLLAGVLACDVLYVIGVGTDSTNVAAECLLGFWLVLWAFSCAASVSNFVVLGAMGTSWSWWAHIGTHLAAFALSLANLIMRLESAHGKAVLPYGIAMTALALTLSLLAARLGRTIVVDPRWGDLDDWDDDRADE